MPGAAVTKEEIGWLLIWIVLIVGLTCLPYLYAYLSTPADMFYTGLIVNPYDGNSYLAKMRQGARGEWLFHLPYTSEDHEGAFIFTFYLLLGRLSALVGLPLIWTYHLARVASGLFLLVVAYYFAALFLENIKERRFALLLIGLSSGVGWLLLLTPLDILTPDLWMPEAITFFSIFANPHFPLAVALMLLTFAWVVRAGNGTSSEGRWRWKDLIPACLASLLLGIVQPFCVLTVYVVLAMHIGLGLIVAFAGRHASGDKGITPDGTRLPWPEIIKATIAGAVTVPLIFYDYYVYTFNPALHAWSVQNLTPSPPPWHYALGYGLVLVLALGGMVWACGNRAFTLQRDGARFLLIWVVVNALLLYAPFSLQRRLVTGLHIPLSILATVGLSRYILPLLSLRRQRLLTWTLIILTLPTNLFLLVASTGGVAKHERPLYIYSEEKEALDWLRENTGMEDVVLASPGMDPFPGTSLLIPAWAGNRVLYGHPFETIEADQKRAQAEAFFQSETADPLREKILKDHRIDYVFYGPEEREWGADLSRLPSLTEVYRNERGIIYRTLLFEEN